MNHFSEAIIEATNLIVEEKLKTLKLDKTIKAEIVSIVDIGTGEYKVKYLGNTFSAFANDLNKKYLIGDFVFIEVPENDFSNKKFIKNTVTTRRAVSLDSSNNAVVIGPTWDKIYTMLPAASVRSGTADESYIFENAENNFASEENIIFKQYADFCEKFQIKASFKTEFAKSITKGNYGLEISFFILETEGEISSIDYRFDLSSFVGSPYTFASYVEQTIDIDIKAGQLLGINYIKLFQEGFEEASDKQDIFVKDIKLQFIDTNSVKDNSYYLQIDTPDGTYFTTANKDKTIKLVGNLMYNNVSLLSTLNCKCYWYKRDLSITLEHPSYDSLAGFGWQRINGNFNILELNTTDVYYKQKYQLIIVYNNEVTIKQTIEITNNMYEGVIPYIYQIYEDNRIALVLNDNIFGYWYISYPDGTYEKINNELVDRIDVTDYLKYSSIIFYCKSYDLRQENVTNSLEYIVEQQIEITDDNIFGLYKLDTNEKKTEERIYYIRNEDGIFIQTEVEEYKPGIYYYETSIEAPQLSIGEKEEEGYYSGMIMGRDAETNEVGIYGYKKGANAVAVSADGSASFGENKFLQVVPKNKSVIIRGDSKITFDQGDIDIKQEEDGIKIFSNSKITISAGDSSIVLTPDGQILIDAPADKQVGIFARFA